MITKHPAVSSSWLDQFQPPADLTISVPQSPLVTESDLHFRKHVRARPLDTKGWLEFSCFLGIQGEAMAEIANPARNSDLNFDVICTLDADPGRRKIGTFLANLKAQIAETYERRRLAIDTHVAFPKLSGGQAHYIDAPALYEWRARILQNLLVKTECLFGHHAAIDTALSRRVVAKHRKSVLALVGTEPIIIVGFKANYLKSTCSFGDIEAALGAEILCIDIVTKKYHDLTGALQETRALLRTAVDMTGRVTTEIVDSGGDLDISPRRSRDLFFGVSHPLPVLPTDAPPYVDSEVRHVQSSPVVNALPDEHGGDLNAQIDEDGSFQISPRRSRALFFGTVPKLRHDQN